MINKVADKIGVGGVWLAALSCTACFPALGSLASALGLGFLSSFEAVAVNTLLLIFAAIALLANIYQGYNHTSITRGLLGVTGPLTVLLTLCPLWQFNWSSYLFYVGIMLMMVMSVIDIVRPLKEPLCRISN
jgi:mercuric ion transport protein